MVCMPKAEVWPTFSFLQDTYPKIFCTAKYHRVNTTELCEPGEEITVSLQGS